MPFLLLFAGFWGGVVAIAALGFRQGSPLTLLYGLDYAGNVCGKQGNGTDLRAYKAQYWLNPNEARARVEGKHGQKALPCPHPHLRTSSCF